MSSLLRYEQSVFHSYLVGVTYRTRNLQFYSIELEYCFFFLEHAGELRTIVLKKGEPYKTPHTPKRKLQITFAPRKEKDTTTT